MIERFGPETGLPLFAQTSEIPSAIPIATDTRKLAELTVKNDRVNLNKKQLEVLRIMQDKPDWTYQELSSSMGWSVNRIIPRVMELRQLGLIVMGGKRQCGTTGMIVQSWRLNE